MAYGDVDNPFVVEEPRVHEMPTHPLKIPLRAGPAMLHPDLQPNESYKEYQRRVGELRERVDLAKLEFQAQQATLEAQKFIQSSTDQLTCRNCKEPLDMTRECCWCGYPTVRSLHAPPLRIQANHGDVTKNFYEINSPKAYVEYNRIDASALSVKAPFIKKYDITTDRFYYE